MSFYNWVQAFYHYDCYLPHHGIVWDCAVLAKNTCCFQAIIVESERLESQSRTQKTWIIAQFPIKTWVKKFPCGWHPGPGNLGQKGLNLPPLMMSPTKKQNPKLSNFLKIRTRKLTAFFEGLNSSLAQLPCKIWSCKVMVKKWLTRGKSGPQGKSTQQRRC